MHMIHIEEIRIRTPAKWTAPRRLPCRRRHGKPSSGAQCTASAPPTPPEPSAGGSRPSSPGHAPSVPNRPPHPTPAPAHPGKEMTKGSPAARGREEAQGIRQVPEGTGQRKQRNTGARNHRRTRKRKGQESRHRGRGRTDGAPGRTERSGTPHQKDQNRPSPRPSRHPATLGGARPARCAAAARTRRRMNRIGSRSATTGPRKGEEVYTHTGRRG